MSSTTSAAAIATPSSPAGTAQRDQGTTAVALFTAIGTAFAIFAAQLGLFEFLRSKLARIYRPKTYLVPERERTRNPGWAPLAWIHSIFTYRDSEVISKCGLDAYFFLRYLQTLLIIFIPLALVILPILLPINALGGNGTNYVNMETQRGLRYNVTGLDTLAWGNVSPHHTHRYWAHLLMAILVIVWVCVVFFFELKIYIRIRQDFLTSAEHRLTASANTILVSAIPKKWLTYKALDGLFDVFPGGIRNIWINRNYDDLLNKISARYKIRNQLEAAETELIKKCKKAQKKQAMKDEKKSAKTSGVKKPTKEEKQQKSQNEDMEANRRARDQGVSAGDPHEVAHTVKDAVNDAQSQPRETDPEAGDPEDTGDQTNFEPEGFFKRGVGGLRDGIGRGLGAFGNQFERAGQTIAGGLRAAGRLDDELEATPGYAPMDRQHSLPAEQRQETASSQPAYASRKAPGMETAPKQPIHTRRDVTVEQSPAKSSPVQNQLDQDGAHSEASLHPTPSNPTQAHAMNQEIKPKTGDSDNWIKFWRGPAVGYPTPDPHGYHDEAGFPFQKGHSQSDRSNPEEASGVFAVIKSKIFNKKPDKEAYEYPQAYSEDFEGDGPGEPVWKKYIKESDRPRHRLPRFSWVPDFLPTIPFISKGKVDTIYWCRKELARLNVEIRLDQEEYDDEDRYPLMNSAFIQFNQQVAAHMACQAVIHHIPKQMAPRDLEIAPMDVIWENMSIKWWEAWVRTLFILCIVSGMIILWAFPVASTALLGNLPSLIQNVPWLHFLNDNSTIRKAINSLAGVLPALGLAILMAVVPPIFYALSQLQGAKTLVQKELSVQNYYFFFLFVQVFLVVSIASSTLNILSSLTNVISIPRTLANNLPKASNYFFSYMILQAFGNSSGALLQYVTLILWFVLPRISDSTARQKFNRATTLSNVNWGTYFPTYTNFACIALIYSVISPMILVFAVITFALYWVANRYCMLYIFKLETDTGGLLYPRAINQTFTGLYVMELCMIGLFFLVQDNNGKVACVPQAIIMLVVSGLTVLFQILLNQSFGPLFSSLPITLEDDAVLRDEQFEHLLEERFTRESARNGQSDDLPRLGDSSPDPMQAETIEMETIPRTTRIKPNFSYIQDRHHRKMKDVEKQEKEFAGVFFSGHDELEDLTPDQRDALVKEAFKHLALRENQPAVWIPRDDLGVSDDEIARTMQFSSHIWVSNTGTGLDSKQRVLFQQNPPDFSEIEHIRL